MNFITLNSNGVSDPRKGPWLRNLRYFLKADFIAIQETHSVGLTDNVIRKFWGNSKLEYAVVDSLGRAGGLAAIWNPDSFSAVQVIKNQRFLYISGHITGVDGILEYFMVGGECFTFISGHEELKMSKLDRFFFVNDLFMSRWPCAKVEVHNRSLSDHCPVSLSCFSADFGPIPFRLFNSWLGDKKLFDLVGLVFGSNQLGVKWDAALAGKLKTLKAEIKKMEVGEKTE